MSRVAWRSSGTRNVHADRPIFEMASLRGWDRILSRSKEYRKLIGRVIGTRGSIEKFHPIKEYQGNMFLKRVLEDSAAFESVTRKFAAAMVLHLTYGYKIKEKGSDPFVDLADKGMLEFSEIMRPGAFLIEVLPIYRTIPGPARPAGKLSWEKFLIQVGTILFLSFLTISLSCPTDGTNYDEPIKYDFVLLVGNGDSADCGCISSTEQLDGRYFASIAAR
ncbi:hypothetical protein DFH08DRAFT_817135 [Mycena albidolilacea]|uniref:Uncharacterized protein n=1 Tax=Mycena albidolilacea TaxID=1033008 RepID=A0AAD7EHU9_9AGAR|nr:hypothetical protein DFH08DRAFT_817135 [Mycena albidolilacea]